MQDRSWLLNPSAIAAAKVCIKIVEDELGIKLKLSHPQFIAMLREYSELTDSSRLAHAYAALISHAEAEGIACEEQISDTVEHAATGTLGSAAKVVPLKSDNTHPAVTTSGNIAQEDAMMPPGSTGNMGEKEYVEYKGKQYQRWRGDKEFRGLYRGQPRYA